ncbi:MAG TPA: DNA polymerase III subunit gamma/tau [Gammaproteobacteria bacterium]|nr:DNA polymerase III subunit gamma/tau [Gammaproteobacteria bacterium]
MSYQVLARKWRPRKFAEMVGQEHVLQALINALDHDRLHHAYLFTGTRGVGKTTVARIFAKSLNCETGVSAEPCGQCSSCLEIDEGRCVDLIEVDAASRTKVEDTRELLDNVQYAPTHARYKVYLIDEVHMLSAHSFNALLKTLEEPPPHVKFLLATTDPKKLPATVLSRCLQFNLKRLTMPLITGHLQYLLDAEKVDTDSAALRLLARAADGSMRDALSLLDQAIAFGGGAVHEAEVRTMLGTIERGQVVELLEALAGADGAGILNIIDRLSQQAPDYEALLAEMLTCLQHIAVAQTLPDAVDEQLDEREKVLELAARMAAEDVQLYYQIGLIGRRDLQLAPDLRGGLEMVLLRMLAFRPAAPGQIETPARQVSKAAEKPAAGESQTTKEALINSSCRRRPASGTLKTLDPGIRRDDGDGISQRFPKIAAQRETAQPVAVSADADWPVLIEAMHLKGMLRELAMNCSIQSRQDGRWQLVLDSNHQQLFSKERLQRLEKLLCDCLQVKLSLAIEMQQSIDNTPAEQQRRTDAMRQADAVTAITDDPNVKAIQKAFDATLHTESIRPVDN